MKMDWDSLRPLKKYLVALVITAVVTYCAIWLLNLDTPRGKYVADFSGLEFAYTFDGQKFELNAGGVVDSGAFRMEGSKIMVGGKEVGRYSPWSNTVTIDLDKALPLHGTFSSSESTGKIVLRKG